MRLTFRVLISRRFVYDRCLSKLSRLLRRRKLHLQLEIFRWNFLVHIGLFLNFYFRFMTSSQPLPTTFYNVVMTAFWVLSGLHSMVTISCNCHCRWILVFAYDFYYVPYCSYVYNISCIESSLLLCLKWQFLSFTSWFLLSLWFPRTHFSFDRELFRTMKVTDIAMFTLSCKPV